LAEPSRNGGAPAVALVLPGGGARGAYEVGAMSVMLPALEARGERVSVFCGTSVGAINAAQLASTAGMSAADQAEAAVGHWRELGKGDVIRPVVGLGLPVTLLRFLGEALEVPGVRLASLLDPTPLAGSLDRWVDWLALRRQVTRGRVRAVCVVATSLSRGGPLAFVDTREPLPAARATDDLAFTRVRLGGEHVRASAAIPMLFPPVEVTKPRAARDHYIDGGTRLNTPIKPALALGAERVIVVGLEPFAGGRASAAGSGPGSGPAYGRRPRLSDVAANVVDGLLVDQVGDDLHRMLAINSFFAGNASRGPSPEARAYRRSRGRPPYRRVSYALVSPEERGAIGRIAESVFERRYAGLRGLRSPDFPVLSRLLGGRTRSRGELLSFLMFDREFVAELIEAGRNDAQRWLDRHPGFWCTDPAHDFDLGHADPDGAHDDLALDEWRELRRL
jgi:NTE family protein